MREPRFKYAVHYRGTCHFVWGGGGVVGRGGGRERGGGGWRREGVVNVARDDRPSPSRCDDLVAMEAQTPGLAERAHGLCSVGRAKSSGSIFDQWQLVC